jgi:hypothetical protein
VPSRTAYGLKKLPTPKGSFGGSSRFIIPDKGKANPASTPATLPFKKTTSLRTVDNNYNDLKRTSSDIAKSNSQMTKQIPGKPTYKGHLKLDLKSKGLSQSVVITPQGDKKVDFSGYNTNASIPAKVVVDPAQSGNQTTRQSA